MTLLNLCIESKIGVIDGNVDDPNSYTEKNLYLVDLETFL